MPLFLENINGLIWEVSVLDSKENGFLSQVVS